MSVNIKERVEAIRKAHFYGPTPMEEAIVSLIEDLAAEIEELAQAAVAKVEPVNPAKP